MKEATGELNGTVVVVLLIAALSAFFFGILWPMMRRNSIKNSKCNDAVCDYTTATSDGWVTCKYYNYKLEPGLPVESSPETITCPYKG